MSEYVYVDNSNAFIETVSMTRDAYKMMNFAEDRITLVAGGADYVPAIHCLKEDGCTVDVFFWGHASRELRQACSKFVSLGPYLYDLGSSAT